MNTSETEQTTRPDSDAVDDGADRKIIKLPLKKREVRDHVADREEDDDPGPTAA